MLKTVNRRKRLDGLSGFKAIALFMVFIWHASFSSLSVNLGARACEFLFVSSGFLVFYNYYDRISGTFVESIQYLKSKIIKMYPLHFLCFFAAAIFKVRSFSQEIFWKGVLNLLCVQSWSATEDVAISFNGVSWYLSSILFCYFVAPFLIVLIKKSKHLWLTFVGALGFRLWLEYISDFYSNTVLFLQVHTNPLIRMLEFFMGMITAAVFLKYSSEKCSQKDSNGLWTMFEFVSCCVLVVAAVLLKDTLYKGCYVALNCIVVFAFAGQKGILSKGLSNIILLKFSNIQYEFYMMHSIFIIIVDSLFRKFYRVPHWGIMAIIAFVLCVFASIIYKKFISKHCTKIMNFLFNQAEKLILV